MQQQRRQRRLSLRAPWPALFPGEGQPPGASSQARRCPDPPAPQAVGARAPQSSCPRRCPEATKETWCGGPYWCFLLLPSPPLNSFFSFRRARQRRGPSPSGSPCASGRRRGRGTGWWPQPGEGPPFWRALAHSRRPRAPRSHHRPGRLMEPPWPPSFVTAGVRGQLVEPCVGRRSEATSAPEGLWRAECAGGSPGTGQCLAKAVPG